jgi:D-alanyl-D-alanine dipeptidase
MTSFVIIAKMIVSNGIAIEIIPYSIGEIIPKMKKSLLVLLFATLLLQAQIPQSRQLLVVTTEEWSASDGVLQRYEKDEKSWRKAGRAVKVKLGRNGLGWGRGLHTLPQNAKIVKKEGDGKAPAGIFTLKQAFGYESFQTNYPYTVYKETDHCVDDVNSKFYNKIIDSTRTEADYKSFEHMKFPKDYYKYGIVVNHNHIDERGAVRGAGSCIFMHIKKVPTAGCTVMDENEIKEIIRWLDEKKKPLLVQGTKEIMPALLQQAMR